MKVAFIVDENETSCFSIPLCIERATCLLDGDILLNGSYPLISRALYHVYTPVRPECMCACTHRRVVRVLWNFIFNVQIMYRSIMYLLYYLLTVQL